jgi:hypothetical protein
MSLFHKLSVAVFLLASAQAATAASVPNIGFESGIAPWMGTGTVINNPSMAHEGNTYAQLKGNQSLLQTVSLMAGQKYEFVWRFISADYLPYNDTSFMFTGAGSTTLADVASLGGTHDTGWQYFSWVPKVNYSGPIVFGVSNIGDNLVDSKLLLDAAVPLPGAALLFGSAFLVAGVLRRRKLTARRAEIVTA